MERSRYRAPFLQTLGAGVALISLPEISSILNLFTFPGGTDEGLGATLDALLFGRGTGGAFVAHADTHVIEGTPQQWLNAPSALVNILDQLGLERRFTDHVNYYEASQCCENFKNQEDTWRQHGFNTFTDVKRVPADRDAAIGVSGNIEGRRLIRAEGASQYQDYPSITLAGADPGVVVAANWLLNENYTPSQKELAQRLTVINKRNVSLEGGQASTRYETPVSSFVYIPRPRHNSRAGSRATGIVAAHNKKDTHNPNNIYFADLYV